MKTENSKDNKVSERVTLVKNILVYLIILMYNWFVLDDALGQSTTFFIDHVVSFFAGVFLITGYTAIKNSIINLYAENSTITMNEMMLEKFNTVDEQLVDLNEKIDKTIDLLD